MSSSTRDLLLKKASKVRAKKRLGQNFLIEPSVLTKIVESLNLRNDDLVVEIGPGLGFLTQELLKTGARVFAIELDREMVEQLQEIKQPNLTVIHADFLDFDISSIAPAAVAAGAKIKIVGNVPYKITTPIITHVFGEIGEPQAWLSSVESLTMTIQREVALRLSAMPGSKTYGQLTLLGNYYSVCKMIMSVGKELFVPQPDVESAVVQMTRLLKPSVKVNDPLFLRKVIAGGFRERRKMLRNNLAFTQLSQETLAEIFEELAVAPSARAENLPLSTFALLADAIQARRNNEEREEAV